MLRGLEYERGSFIHSVKWWCLLYFFLVFYIFTVCIMDDVPPFSPLQSSSLVLWCLSFSSTLCPLSYALFQIPCTQTFSLSISYSILSQFFLPFFYLPCSQTGGEVSVLLSLVPSSQPLPSHPFYSFLLTPSSPPSHAFFFSHQQISVWQKFLFLYTSLFIYICIKHQVL